MVDAVGFALDVLQMLLRGGHSEGREITLTPLPITRVLITVTDGLRSAHHIIGEPEIRYLTPHNVFSRLLIKLGRTDAGL
jgi:hypothetical protein